jgi:uncharacterized protein (UPF0264 family)
MTGAAVRLLVSVTDAQEAAAVLAGGAHIVDVKDPSRGSLGMADAPAIRAVMRCCAGRAPVSAALGELHEHAAPPLIAHEPLQFVKVGLAAAPADWQLRLQAFSAHFRDRFVAVAYADHDRAAAPPMHEVLDWALRHRAAALLVDTAVKDGRRLFDWCSDRQLASLVAAARQAGLAIALAGSLDEDALTRAANLGPDIVAVRGAACDRGDRRARVLAPRVRQLVERITTGGRTPPGPHAG